MIHSKDNQVNFNLKGIKSQSKIEWRNIERALVKKSQSRSRKSVALMPALRPS